MSDFNGVRKLHSRTARKSAQFRRRLLMESLEDRSLLAVDLQVILQLFDTSNVAITGPVTQGTEVVLHARVKDVRTPAQGVSSTYLDLTFPSQVTVVSNSVAHGSTFNFDTSNGTLAGSTITDIGGADTDQTKPAAVNAADEFELFSVHFTASTIGTGDFTALIGDGSLLTRLFPASGTTTVAPDQVDINTVSLTVQAADNNQPPVNSVPASVTANEDTTVTFTAGNLLSISDPDAGAAVVRTSLLIPSGAGTLSVTASGGTVTGNNSESIQIDGTITQINDALATLSYVPTLNRNNVNVGSATILTMVTNDLGNTGGPAKTDTDAISINLNAVNDAPTATNLNAGETYTEDNALNLTDIVVSDVDSATVTVTLTLSNIAAGSLNTGTSGAVTSTYNSGTGVWSASGAIADVNALLAGLTFTPTRNFSNNFTIATSVSDGVAAEVTGTKAMTGTAVNDSPTATNLNAAETYTEDTPLNLTDIVISDVDSPNVTATLTLSNAAAGSLNTGTSGAVTSTYNSGTGAWSASGAIADVNALLAGLTFSPALDFNSNFTIATSVSDGVAAAVTGTKSLTGTAVNDAPTATNLNAGETYTEDTPLNLTDIVVSDVDSANVTVTLTLSNTAAGSLNSGTSGAVTSTFNAGTGVWTASGALADVNVLLASLTLTPALNFNSNFSIATSVSDTVAAPITGSKAMTGAPVNDAPTATNLNAEEIYTEDTPLNLTDIVVSDVDSTNVTVTLTLSNTAAGSLSTATSGAVTSTYNSGTGVWSASGLLADVNALLAGLTFNPASNFNGNFTIATSVSDGVAPALTGSKSLTGTAVNDPPTATNLNAAETYTQNLALNLVDIVVSDIDSTNVTATLTLSNPSAGSLSTATSGAVTSTYNNGTGLWSASGPIADVNTLLAGVVFNPTTNFTSNFNIATSVSDGVAPAVTGTKAMSSNSVNQPPTATNLNAAETYTEDTPLNLTDIVVSDTDSANLTVTLTLSNTSAGSLNTGSSGAVTSTYNAGTGVWSANGLIADINTLLAGLTFTPALNFNSNFTIQTSVSDGVAAAVTGSKVMTGTAVNDPPIATNLNAAEAYTQNVALNLTDIVVSDVDSPNVTVTLTLSNTAAGSLNTATSGAVTSTYNSGTGVWSASGALADVNTLLSGLTFTPANNFTSTFTIATSVSDGTAPAVTGSKSFNASAANTPPTTTNRNAAETYTEDTPLNLTDMVVSDVDSANVTVTLTLSNPVAGSLNTGTSGAVTSTYVSGTGVWTASGAIADVNTLLAGLTFTPALNFNSNFDVATSISDGSNTITGSKAMTGVAVNDAPTATNLNAAETYTEDTVLNLTDIVVSDVDSPTVTVTLTLSNSAAGSLNTGTSGAVTSTYNAGTGVWSASGAIANVNTLLAGLTFTPAQNFNSNFTIATSVSDGTAPAVTGSKAVTGTAVNDPPTATNLNAAETYTEDTALNLTDIVVSDVDSTNVTVTLTLSNATAGSLNTGTSGAVTSTYNAGTGVWSASGALANVNTLLAGLAFTPTLNFNSNFTIATSVSDGVAAAVTGSKVMTGTAVNDPPTATNLNTAETYVEDTPLNLTDIVVSDVDSPNITITLTLSDPTAGSLNTGTSGAVTSTYNASTGVWSANGAIANVNTLLAGLTFTPAANFNDNFSISSLVDDGVASVVVANRPFTGTPVNDVPTFTLSGNPPTINAGLGQQTIANFITNISRGGGSDETSQTVTFIVTPGTTTGGLLFSQPPAISSTGTLTYTPQGNTTGTATFTVRIQDNGGTANGGVDTSATQSFTITVGVSSLAGIVYCDYNGNGTRDANEIGLPNVVITLTGTDSTNTTVTRTTTTAANGSYSFDNLQPGTYTLRETQPAGFIDGTDTVGTLGGTVGSDQFTSIVIAGGTSGTGYNFGEAGLNSSAVGLHLSLCSTPTGEKLGAMLIPASGQTLRVAPAAFNAQVTSNATSAAVPPIRSAQLQPLLVEAVQRFAKAGITAAQQAKLANVQLAVDNLPNDVVGLARGNQITLDTNGAGLGWFVDSTPESDSEFTTKGLTPQGLDALTVISHELAHVLGMEHDEEDRHDLLAAFVVPGERKSPTRELIDHYFANTGNDASES